jgi:hypothetical protein
VVVDYEKLHNDENAIGFEELFNISACKYYDDSYDLYE